MVERGHLQYKYTIKIDLEDLADRIIKEIRGYVDDYDITFDDNNLVLKCQDFTAYTCYSSPATMLDPPEEDMCFESIEDADVEQAVLDAFHDTEKVKVEVNVDHEHIHYMGDYE